MRIHTVQDDERQLLGYRFVITIANGFRFGLGMARVVVCGVAVIVWQCVGV